MSIMIDERAARDGQLTGIYRGHAIIRRWDGYYWLSDARQSTRFDSIEAARADIDGQARDAYIDVSAIRTVNRRKVIACCGRSKRGTCTRYAEVHTSTGPMCALHAGAALLQQAIMAAHASKVANVSIRGTATTLDHITIETEGGPVAIEIATPEDAIGINAYAGKTMACVNGNWLNPGTYTLRNGKLAKREQADEDKPHSNRHPHGSIELPGASGQDR